MEATMVDKAVQPQISDDELYEIRHSLAHILAQAVLEIRPGSTLGFGPPIKDGFYYDFILSEPITEADFPEIEKLMKKIIKKNQKFEREDLDFDAAMQRLDDMGEPYKKEYAKELFEKQNLDKLTFYTNGPFLDMCEGPHVESTRKIPKGCFKLKSVAGAYWRGNSDNVMMTRIYAFAFANKEELEKQVELWEQAKERDHKKLGRQLGIFTIDEEVGKGLPLWLPNGTVVRDELEKFAKELEFKADYKRVTTPNLTRADLFYKSGHLPYYEESMYPLMEIKDTSADADGQTVKETYALRPMNCPHHHKVFAAQNRSYRDLPLRLAEYGDVYRKEDSGAVSGLLRVRCMCMNDAHIYCTPEQVKDEFKAVMHMYEEAYSVLGIENYKIRLSTWDPEDEKGKEKYVDDPQAWEYTTKLLAEVLDELNIKYEEGKGEGAFYGPKIDVQFVTVTGREETASTVQLDFAVPKRLGLTYIGSDGAEHTPYVIHRAPLGTHERFVAFLLELYAGAFPIWLAPIQVRVVPVSDKFADYAKEVVADLRGSFVRAELAQGNETVSKQVRQALTEKIPNILVIGEREMQDKTVTIRKYGQKEQSTKSFAEYKQQLLELINTRSRKR